MRLKSVMRAAAKGIVFRKKDLSSSRIDLSTGGKNSEETSAEFKLIFLDRLEQTEKVRQKRRDMDRELQDPSHHILIVLRIALSQCEVKKQSKAQKAKKL